jgi:hypothetical protein
MAPVLRSPAVRGYLQVTDTDEIFGTRRITQRHFPHSGAVVLRSGKPRRTSRSTNGANVTPSRMVHKESRNRLYPSAHHEGKCVECGSARSGLAVLGMTPSNDARRCPRDTYRPSGLSSIAEGGDRDSAKRSSDSRDSVLRR